MNNMKKNCFILMTLIGLLSFFTSTAEAQKLTKVTTNRYGLKLNIKSVQAFERKVVIEGVFQNNDDSDIGVNMRGYWTEAFDDEGNRYTGDAFSFGLGSKSMGSGVGSVIPAGTSLKMRVEIKGVPEAASYIDYLKIDTYPETDKNIIIRNLPISREGDE